MLNSCELMEGCNKGVCSQEVSYTEDRTGNEWGLILGKMTAFFPPLSVGRAVSKEESEDACDFNIICHHYCPHCCPRRREVSLNGLGAVCAAWIRAPGAGLLAACGGPGPAWPLASRGLLHSAEARGVGFCFSSIVENLKTLVLLQTRDGALSSVTLSFRKRKWVGRLQHSTSCSILLWISYFS